MKPTKEYNGRSRIRMFNCDCMDLMKTGTWDLAIVDPPYGIGDRIKGTWGKETGMNEATKWDYAPDEYYFKLLFERSENQIIWGANYFIEHLNSSMGVICWDKMNGTNNLSDFEFCWTSFNDKTARMFRMHHFSDGYDKKIHPTQKPSKLYRWLLKNYGPECNTCKSEGSYYEDVAGDGGSKMLMHCDICDGSGRGTILDTHGGSLSIAIACWDLGFDLDVCELDTDYFNDAVKRFESHIAQTQLF